MTNVTVKGTINVPADVIWKTLSSFRDVEQYIPLLKTSTFSYSITSSPLPLVNYLSTVKVKDLGNEKCEVEWSSTFEPKGMAEEEVAKMMNDIYVTAIDGLKKLHGG